MKIKNAGAISLTILLYPTGNVNLAAGATSAPLHVSTMPLDHIQKLVVSQPKGAIEILLTVQEYSTIIYNYPNIDLGTFASIDPNADIPNDQIPGITVGTLADINLAVGVKTTPLGPAVLTIPEGVTAGTNGWVYTSGALPSGTTPTVTPATGLSATANGLGFGTMIFTFSGTDSNGKPYGTTQNVIVPAPAAVTLTPVTYGGITGTSQVLAGTYGGYTTGATYAWVSKSFPAGGSAATFSSSTIANPTVNNLTVVGNYVVTVTVTNAYGQTFPFDVTLTKTA